jgi:hypothetical protein
MKIDVEGHEFQVLSGAQRLLKRDHPIIYTELWDEVKDPVVNLLSKFDYKIASIIEYDGCYNYEFFS